MPYNVGDVKFMIDPLRLIAADPGSLGVKVSELEGSAGVEDPDESFKLNTRWGRGRKIGVWSDMMGEKSRRARLCGNS
jgi:hypothetical protein